MDELRTLSQQSLLESDRSNDSVLAESLQLEVEDLDDDEYAIPTVAELPTLAAVLSGDYDSESEFDTQIHKYTPTPSIAEDVAIRLEAGLSAGSIMRYALLQGVSAQLSSAADRINAGLASACAICDYIAIGTSHGHILNYDITQTLLWAYQDKNAQGTVTTLSFNVSGTRLLAGYARGLVQMFDTQRGDVLRNLTDVITPNTGILHVKWTSRTSLAICADTGGSIWSLSFTRKLGLRGCDSACIFSGARGEVCAMEPLILEDTRGSGVVSQFAELDQYCIVALATLSKYFIITIRPRLKVIKHHALNGPVDCLPLLSWQMVLIQAADNTRSVDPVIVVGRGQQLFFHQLFISNGRISLLYLRYVQLHTNLMSTHWLGPKHVACMDTSEILHLIDVRSTKQLESFDMANAGLVYASAQFKGLATGGNVSPALALAGKHACYNSMAVRGSQLYILGARSLHMIGVRSWCDRISYLVKNQRWQEACDIALEGYRAANNSAASKPKRKLQAKERIVLLFEEYLASTALVHEYCLAAIVKCVIFVEETEKLLMQLWERLTNGNRAVFLEIISEHISNDNISYLNPSISQALVEHWLSVHPKKLEDLILKLDWTCLDLNQAMKAAKSYSLYRAQIYLNTQALHDYTVSLIELLPLLQADEAANLSELGNCLLVYISSCLAGRGYPVGDIPAEEVAHAKYEVLRCLTSTHPLQTLSSSNDINNKLPYPYLRALLKFDTRETLNVISLAFQEPEFNGQEGQKDRKRIINILLQIMTPEYATWSEIGCLLNYIAQQISLQYLPREPALLRTVLSYLATERITDESARQHAERENAWLELLTNNCLNGISSDEEQLELAQRAQCHSVAECLLEKLQRYDNILKCYLTNEARYDAAFAYIERHVRQPERNIYSQLETNLSLLIKINAAETARVIKTYFMSQLDKLLEIFENQQELAYMLLQQLYVRQAELSSTQCELFIDLLCMHGTHCELNYFLTTAKDRFNANKALEIVRRHQRPEAIILLHEQQKQYTEAFNVALQLLQASKNDEAEIQLSRLTALCARACKVDERHADLWLRLLQEVLPRSDLQAVTKVLLCECTQYIDLQKMVELIMSTSEISGSFGDIKIILLDMLAHARSEQSAMANSIQVIGNQMHALFDTHFNEVRRGLFATSLRCSYCQQRLVSDSGHILLSGACGHALHELCAQEYAESEKSRGENRILCLRCQNELPGNLQNGSPVSLSVMGSTSILENGVVLSPIELKLKAPPINFC